MPNPETATAADDPLLALLKRYHEQRAEFDRKAKADPEGRFPEGEYQETLKQVVGVYPRTWEGASAALELIKEETEEHTLDLKHEGLYAEVCRSLFDGLEAFLADRGKVDDPLVEIGREITRLHDRIRILEAREGLSPMEKNYIGDEHSDIWDRIDCLRGYATTLQAKSLTGALVQLGVAVRLFDVATEDRDAPEWRVDDARLQFKRVVYSILQALQETDITIGAGDHAFFVSAPEYMNPWAGYERQVALANADTEAERELERQEASLDADAELVALGQRWLEAQGRFLAVCGDDEAAAPALEELSVIEKQIVALPATTLAGVMAKVYIAVDHGPKEDDPTEGGEVRAAVSIRRDLEAMGIWPGGAS